MQDDKVFYGSVIWFSRGMGFIKPDDSSCNSGADVFVHFSDLEMEGYRTLNKDARVQFSIGLNNRGQNKAIAVKTLP
jgi:CspA family cold shock protein